MSRALLAFLVLCCALPLAGATRSADLPVTLPLFPAQSWWNVDVSAAPVDGGSASFIQFIGPTRGMHPDFGGDAGGGDVYGFPVIQVEGTQAKKTVSFFWPDQSDGVDHSTEESYPFYPVPDEAISMTGWVEGGQPGSLDQRGDEDRHILMVDVTNNRLYELYNVWFNGTSWEAGSGAAFFMNRSDRRPDTWTSADAAGLAILPGLVRHDEVFGPGEIRHAFRMTVRSTNGYVFPASHRAGSTAGALPMGARLRLKASKDLSTFPAEIQKILRAFKKYGLIVADNGSDMYVSGTYDTRWNNDVLNPQLARIKASDFEVVQLGWSPSVILAPIVSPTAASSAALDLQLTAYDRFGNVATGYRGTVQFTSSDAAATLPGPYTFTAADAGIHLFPRAVTLRTPGAQLLTTSDSVVATITGSRGVVVTTRSQSVPLEVTWACFHYTSRPPADAHLASRNDDATLVSTGDATYPYVVIERWTCGSCAQVPAPLFLAFPLPPGYTPTASERVATGTDGTILLVRRVSGGSSLERSDPATVRGSRGF